MNKYVVGAIGVLAMGSGAHAGGLDRSGQGVAALFEDGGHVEFSYGQVSPSVTGTLGVGSGNVADSYNQTGFAIKTDVNEKTSLALIVDQPFGANVDYTNTDPGYPLAGTTAVVNTTSYTALARYKLNGAISLHGGVRQLTSNGSVNLVFPGAYASTYSGGSGMGYVLGAAYEKPEIALRVALTYASGIAQSLDGTLGDLSADMPASVNLDFQTGVAADTLVFGSVRWVDWSSVELTDTLAGTLVSYDQDTVSYSLGVGRKFSDTFSGALTLGYEAAQGGTATDLAPTDGYLSIGLGGTYTMGNSKITAGLRYVNVGDATATSTASFTDNSAIGFGLKVSTSF